MTPPIQASDATPTAPAEESPEIKAARDRYQQAGYARNRAEAQYNQAKKDHGANSSEATTAKATLDQAQSEVEKTGSELSKILGLKKISKAPKASTKDGKPAPAPAPTPEVPTTPHPSMNPVIHGEYIERHEVLIRKVLIIDPKLQERLHKLLQEMKNHPENSAKILEMISPPRGEMSIQHSYFRKLPDLPAEKQAPKEEPAPKPNS